MFKIDNLLDKNFVSQIMLRKSSKYNPTLKYAGKIFKRYKKMLS